MKVKINLLLQFRQDHLWLLLLDVIAHTIGTYGDPQQLGQMLVIKSRLHTHTLSITNLSLTYFSAKPKCKTKHVKMQLLRQPYIRSIGSRCCHPWRAGKAQVLAASPCAACPTWCQQKMGGSSAAHSHRALGSLAALWHQ